MFLFFLYMYPDNDHMKYLTFAPFKLNPWKCLQFAHRSAKTARSHSDKQHTYRYNSVTVSQTAHPQSQFCHNELNSPSTEPTLSHTAKERTHRAKGTVTFN